MVLLLEMLVEESKYLGDKGCIWVSAFLCSFDAFSAQRFRSKWIENGMKEECFSSRRQCTFQGKCVDSKMRALASYNASNQVIASRAFVKA